jgi:hypothetical protein
MKKNATKKVSGGIVILHQTHAKELSTGMDNRPIHNPYLKEEDKVNDPDEFLETGEPDPNEHFDDGELPYGKKLGLLHETIKRSGIKFEYLHESEDFEVMLDRGDGSEQLRYFFIDPETRDYTYALYEGEYIPVLVSKNIADVYKLLTGTNFRKRQKLEKCKV